MPTSQNGWPANDVNLTDTQAIPGTVRQIRLRKGDAGFLLRHLAAWFDKNIETIDNDGELDDWGYAERPIRGSSTDLSNHASGTAIDLNAPEHPLGVRGTFTDTQENAIRTQLREYDGVIRWGGDYQNRADEMHFEINATAQAVAVVADRIRQGDTVTPQDIEAIANRTAALVLEELDKPVKVKDGNTTKLRSTLQQIKETYQARRARP